MKKWLCFGILLLTVSNFANAQEVAESNPELQALIAKSDTGDADASLALAAIYLNRHSGADLKKAETQYWSVLTNENATPNQKQISRRVLSQEFAWDCNNSGGCRPVQRRLDASLDGFSFDNPTFSLEKWHASSSEYMNAQFGVLMDRSNIKYEYNEIIAEAREGDIFAMLLCAYYFRSSGQVENGAMLSAQYLKKAAELGNPYAIGEFGFLIWTGEIQGASRAEAIQYYERAIDLGDPRAMQRLATIKYSSGDLQGAKELYLRGAALGYVPSMESLGFFHEENPRGSPDFDTAFYWYKKAFDNKTEPILPHITFMFHLIYDENERSEIVMWAREKQSHDPTIDEYRALWVKSLNTRSDEQIAQNRADFIALAAKGGYGSVLAALRAESWYTMKCSPKGEMSYSCMER